MALFRKTIVGPAVYRVNTPAGRVLAPVTKKVLKEMCNTANEMIRQGFKIPCPFAHRDENGDVPGILKESNGDEVDAKTGTKKRWSSDINAGFWKSFSIDDKGRLEGIVSVPGDESDPNSIAYKFGKTIQETSIFYDPEFEDSSGRKWKHVLKHVAAVINPVEPNQSNFESLKSDPEYSLSMTFGMSDEVNPTKSSKSEEDSEPTTTTTSDSDTTEPDGDEDDKAVEANVSEVTRLFKEKLQIEFPSDTTFSNFLDRLRAILTSLPTDKQEDLAAEEPKEKSKPEDKVQIAMADETKVMPKKLEKLFDQYFSQLKQALKDRIDVAVQSGKIGKRYAEQVFYPELEALAMSYDDLDEDGNYSKSTLEIRLEMAEQLDSILDKSTLETPSGSEEKKPDGQEIKASQEELNSVYSMV